MKNKDLDAFKQAIKDFDTKALTEEELDDFYDERKSSKCDDPNYEKDDGKLEISYKKMVKTVNKYRESNK